MIDIKEVIGRLTQISADTRNDTMDIKAAQKASDTQLNQITNKLDSLGQDHSELKANVVLVEARTKVLEDMEIERKEQLRFCHSLECWNKCSCVGSGQFEGNSGILGLANDTQ